MQKSDEKLKICKHATRENIVTHLRDLRRLRVLKLT